MKLETEYITDNAEFRIGYAARHCYDAKTDEAACVRRAAQCRDKGHLATMRFASATFSVSGISRACSHQFVRAKHLDFLQRSQRYCDEGDTTFVTPPAIAADAALAAKVEAHFQASLALYGELRAAGIRKEDARYVLPEATCTTLAVTGNFQAWQDFLKNRTDPASQWEIRSVANGIRAELAATAPNIFKENEHG